MLTHLENEAAQIESALRASLQSVATESVVASPASHAASSPSADTPKTIVADSPPASAASPPASAASVRTLEQLHEARAQIALLEQRNKHLESVVDGLLKPYGKLKSVVEWWSTMEL